MPLERTGKDDLRAAVGLQLDELRTVFDELKQRYGAENDGMSLVVEPGSDFLKRETVSTSSGVLSPGSSSSGEFSWTSADSGIEANMFASDSSRNSEGIRPRSKSTVRSSAMLKDAAIKRHEMVKAMETIAAEYLD